MIRRTRVWALLGATSCALACGNEAAPPGPSASAGTAGTSPGVAGTGGAGTGGSAPATAGSAGQSMAGTTTGGTSAGAGGAPSGGAGAGGAAGSGGGAGGTGGAAGSSGASGAGGSGPSLPKRVLLYHLGDSAIGTAMVAAQITLFKNQLTTWGYESEDSVKPEDISTTNLARFGGVGMINTCFEPFGAGKTGETQTAALKAFVEGGGGLFGTHCASVTFQTAKPPNPYNDVIGGRGGDGSYDGMSACTTTAEAHVSTAMLAPTFNFTGNLDNADYVAADSKVLIKCKWSSGAMKEHAVSWYRTPGKGRVFYTNFAKVAADISDATLGQKHILVGLGWTLGR